MKILKATALCERKFIANLMCNYKDQITISKISLYGDTENEKDSLYFVEFISSKLPKELKGSQVSIIIKDFILNFKKDIDT
jgi:hypothetical protein